MTKIAIPMLIVFVVSLVLWGFWPALSPTGTPLDGTATTGLVGAVAVLVYGVRWLAAHVRRGGVRHD